MSPLLAILRLCAEQYNNLNEDEIRTLLSVAIDANRPAEARKIKATVTKPVLVSGATFKVKSGKKVIRKPHRRAKPGMKLKSKRID